MEPRRLGVSVLVAPNLVKWVSVGVGVGVGTVSVFG